MELDRLTLERARRGDRAAQDAFLKRYVRPLHGFVRRAGPPGDADDLTQELLGKLLRVLPQFEPDGPAQLTTWVFTVAHRWLLDEKKRRHLQVAPIEEGMEVADVRPGADRLLEQKELARALDEAIARLPEAQRRVFVLAQVQKQPLDCIADVERVPVGTIKSRLHRAKAALASMLSSQLWEGKGAAGHVA